MILSIVDPSHSDPRGRLSRADITALTVGTKAKENAANLLPPTITAVSSSLSTENIGNHE
jgi:hypothetical protein